MSFVEGHRPRGRLLVGPIVLRKRNMNILFVTDGSDCSLSAAQFLTTLPLAASATVTVLSVADGLPDEYYPDSAATRQLQADLTEHARQVADQASRAIAWPAAVTVTARYGRPARVIGEVAAEAACDLVVMGSHGRTGLRRFLLGSVSRDVLLHAPCSVLIGRAPIGCSPRPLKLLIAHDGGPVGDALVERAATTILSPDATVQVIHVMQTVNIYRQDLRQRLSAHWAERRTAANARIDAATLRLRSKCSNVQGQVIEAPSISNTLLDQAQDMGADLILVGIASASDARRLLLGSVAARVAEHSACSVWVER